MNDQIVEYPSIQQINFDKQVKHAPSVKTGNQLSLPVVSPKNAKTDQSIAMFDQNFKTFTKTPRINGQILIPNKKAVISILGEHHTRNLTNDVGSIHPPPNRGSGPQLLSDRGHINAG